MRTLAVTLALTLALGVAMAGEAAAPAPAPAPQPTLTADQVKTALKDGEKAFNEGKFKDAEDFFVKVFQADDKNYDAALYLGKIYTKWRLTFARALAFTNKAKDLAKTDDQKKKVDELKAQLEKVAALDQDLDMAVRYYYQRRVTEALEKMAGVVKTDASRVLNLLTDDPAILVLAGRALAAEGKDAEARDAYARALVLDPTEVGARLGLGVLGLKLGEKDPDGSKVAVVHFAAGLQALDDRRRTLFSALTGGAAAIDDTKGALQSANAALSAANADILPIVIVAVEMMAKGQKDGAKEVLAKIPTISMPAVKSLTDLCDAILNDKTNATQLFKTFNAALTCAAIGWHEQAVPIWDELVKKFPKNAFVLAAKANSERDQATTIEALKNLMDEYEAVLKLEPQYSPALSALGKLAIGLKDMDKAETYYKKLVELEPKLGSGHYFLGYVYRMKKQADQAIKEYDLAGEYSPASVEPFLESANLLIDQKKYDEALARAQKAQKAAEPLGTQYSAVVADVMGWVLFNKGDTTGASQQLLNSVAILPGRASTHYHLGELYAKLNEKDKAIASLTKALELSKDSPDSAAAQALLDKLQGKPAPKK